MVHKPWQKTGFRSFEDYSVKKYASKNGKIDTKISGYKLKGHLKVFKKIESFFVPRSIEIFHILCIFSFDYDVVEVNYIV